MRIYSPPDNHQLAKVLFTAQLARTPLLHEPVPYGYKNKHFQEQNALFTTPALETSPNSFTFGTHAILRRLAPLPSTPLIPFQQAQVDQWLELIERELEPAVGVLILQVHQLAEVREEQLVRAKEVVLRVMKQVEERLKSNTFLVGCGLTIADVSCYYSWRQVAALLEKETKALVVVQRWARHIASIPSQ